MEQLKHITKKQYQAAAAGLLAGILLFIVFRLAVVTPVTHYHANFAVFVNGEREAFDGPLYYEEVQACSADTIGPRTRVHMHQPENNVVHVHDEGATWAHLFSNLGWTLGNTVLSDGVDVYETNDTAALIFILNGEPTKNIANRVIGSEDRLLVSYSAPGTDLGAQFDQVEASAPSFNDQPDPGACSGADYEGPVGRIKRAIFE